MWLIKNRCHKCKHMQSSHALQTKCVRYLLFGDVQCAQPLVVRRALWVCAPVPVSMFVCLLPCYVPRVCSFGCLVMHAVCFVLWDGVRNIIKKMGVVGVDTVEECTHLYTDKVTRTLKTMEAIGLGKFIVGEKWAKDSVAQNRILDGYTLKDNANEKKWHFDLKETLAKSREKKIFEGKQCLVHKTATVCVVLVGLDVLKHQRIERKGLHFTVFVWFLRPNFLLGGVWRPCRRALCAACSLMMTVMHVSM